MVTPLSEKKGNLDSFFPLFYNFSDETNLFFHSYTAQPDPFPVPGSVRGGRDSIHQMTSERCAYDTESLFESFEGRDRAVPALLRGGVR